MAGIEQKKRRRGVIPLIILGNRGTKEEMCDGEVVKRCWGPNIKKRGS